jgi:hypothetical protein
MTHDQQVTTLLHDATEELSPDVGRLVAGGAARGRVRQRRNRAGTALAAVAVLGVIGAAASVLPDRSAEGRGVGIADSPSVGTSRTQPASDRDAPAPIAWEPEQIRDRLLEMLPAGEAGPILRGDGYPVVSTPDSRILHFRFDGALTSFLIEPADSLGTCEQQVDPASQPHPSSGDVGTCSTVDGLDVLTWGPTLADRVTAQGVTVWQHGYAVSLVSYDAPDGKDVAPVLAEPPLSLAELTELASSEVWFG